MSPGRLSIHPNVDTGFPKPSRFRPVCVDDNPGHYAGCGWRKAWSRLQCGNVHDVLAPSGLPRRTGPGRAVRCGSWARSQRARRM
ncbi:hypothetical protein J6590_003773 [Homalodisca vitripennis]|nr:hypothetical protein J6590_003773 [Homalodisca vitripennis]